MITPKRFVLGSIVVLVASTAQFLFAASPNSYYVPSNKYPPTGRYVGRSEDTLKYSPGIWLRNVILRNLAHVGAPPSLGANQTYSFNGTVDFELSSDGGGHWSPGHAPASVFVKLDHTSDAGSTAVFQTEMLSLNLSGGDLPAGVLIRESPTIASTGKLHIQPSSDGGYLIDSFFDVFTELSDDGGGTFHPATASMELDLSYPSMFNASSGKYPPVGKYLSKSGEELTWDIGVLVRNLTLRDMTHVDILPALLAGHVYNFNATMDMDLSTDGGTSWHYAKASSAVAVNLTHTDDDGTGRFFDTEMLQLNISGGDLPVGLLMRESPTRASTGKLDINSDSSGGYHIDSFFDVFFELTTDGGSTFHQTAQALPMELSYPSMLPFANDSIPPDGRYVSKPANMVTWLPGVIGRAMVLRNSSDSFTPPVLGGTQIKSFNDSVQIELSFNGGLTFNDEVAPGAVTLRSAHRDDDSTAGFFDTEMLSLNISGGTLPGGLMIRESPTIASTGRLDMRPAGGGDYIIGSFFDVFFELSSDGGASWSPGSNPFSLELVLPCPVITISPSALPVAPIGASYNTQLVASGGTPPYGFSLLNGALPAGISLAPNGTLSGFTSDYGIFGFNVMVEDSNGCTGVRAYSLVVTSRECVIGSRKFPPNGKYKSRQGVAVSYAAGIWIRNLVLRDLDFQGALPPLAGNQTYNFTGTVNIEYSTNSGASWIPGQGQGPAAIHVHHSADDGSTGLFDTELLQLTLSGGTLPVGTMLRESPTRASTGFTTTRPGPAAAWEVSSFFDVFTELSTDGGATWFPGSDSMPIALTYPTEYFFGSSQFPPNGSYTNRPEDVISFPGGKWIRNLIDRKFSHSSSLPPITGDAFFSFNDSVYLEISTDGGATWAGAHGASADQTHVIHTSDDSSASFFDTEMLQLDISGGTIPGGMMLRESPTRASTGRTNVRSLAGGGYLISSFFDVFTELSTDGGGSWSPALNYVTLDLVSMDTVHVSIQQAWNMLSVPVLVDDYHRTSLFPTASSPAFAYDGSYVLKDILANEIGYWLRFPGSSAASIVGMSILEDSIPVTTGWNLIGSVTKPVAVSTIASSPPGVTTSRFFGYAGSYTTADTIKPGRAYWVKAGTNGMIILSASGSTPAANRLRIVPGSELPPPPPEATTIRPALFALRQNYPNPFNPATTITFDLPAPSLVTLKVFNLLGQEIATLVNERREAGRHEVRFDGGNLTSGLYICRISAGGYRDTRKMLLLR